MAHVAFYNMLPKKKYQINWKFWVRDERRKKQISQLCCIGLRSKSVRRSIMDHSDKDELIIALNFVVTKNIKQK